MVGLEGVVKDAEATSLTRSAQAVLELTHQPNGAERRHVGPHLQRHVAGETRREPRPTAMGSARDEASRPSCTGAPPAPAEPLLQSQLQLSCARCHRAAWWCSGVTHAVTSKLDLRDVRARQEAGLSSRMPSTWPEPRVRQAAGPAASGARDGPGGDPNGAGHLPVSPSLNSQRLPSPRGARSATRGAPRPAAARCWARAP